MTNRDTRINKSRDPNDPRTPFERDRDRIFHCRSFRRLSGVAQVVTSETTHTYHDRLIHSLKVGQVGRRLAERFEKEYSDEEDNTIENVGGLDPDVVETAALAHDLGHPPFGHIAEKKLDDKTTNNGVPGGFEGNAQSFRIVVRVAPHSTDDYDGLDLTLASLNAMLKYPWSRGTGGDKRDKWGYYHSENEEFETVRNSLSPPDNEDRSAEAEIMDWADDIVYAIHDLTDFYMAGVIPLGELLRDTKERSEFLDYFENEHSSDIRGPWSAHHFLEVNLPKIRSVADTIDDWDPLHSPFKNTRSEKSSLKFLSSSLLERYMGVPEEDNYNIELSTSSPDNYQPSDSYRWLSIPDILQNEVLLLKSITEKYVFNHPTLLAQEKGYEKIIGTVWDCLYEAASEGGRNIEMIPPPFKQNIKATHQNTEDPERKRARFVADLIASMTEKQVIKYYERLSGQSIGSIRDRVID